MPTNRKMRGETVNFDSPNWGPLERLIGPDLAAGFMWMYEVELRNRTRIHAYKHSDTRAYLHLTRDGRCYTFEPLDSYRQITQYQGITAVYRLWTGSEPPPALALTPRQWAALAFARQNACFRLLDEGDDTVLMARPTSSDPFRRRDLLIRPDDEDREFADDFGDDVVVAAQSPGVPMPGRAETDSGTEDIPF